MPSPGKTPGLSDPLGPHRVFVLGAGRAGRSIAVALAAAGRPVIGLHGRRPPEAGPSASGVAQSRGELRDTRIADADVVLVTVRDAQLDEALGQLAATPLAPRTVVLHASGAADPAGLADLRAAGHPVGTFHPLVPLADSERGAELLRGAWIGVDGDGAARDAGRALASAVGANVLEIPAGAKPAYHAAAVFASNFPVVLAAAAASLLRGAGVDPSSADGAVQALITGAVGNLAARPLDGRSVAAALTGPIARGDAATVALHLDALGDAGPLRGAYLALSRLTADTIRAAGTESPRLDEIQRLLDDQR